jgi:MGT family glycosyltransferase
VPAVAVRVTPLPTARSAGTQPATVYLTFGTVWNRDLDAFRVVLAALSAHAVDVVVTLGADGDPAALGAQPDNVHVHRFIAQDELLPRCDAVISHGGAGTMLGALAHGLPLLLLPQGADQHYNAERVVAAGAGLSVGPAQATTATIARAVDTLLGDTGLRAGAQRVAAELASMPGPDSAVAHLQALARPPATAW